MARFASFLIAMTSIALILGAMFFCIASVVEVNAAFFVFGVVLAGVGLIGFRIVDHIAEIELNARYARCGLQSR